MTIKSVKLSDALNKNGKSREFAKTMSDEEIHKRALRDPDNPPLTDEALAQFRPVGEVDRIAMKREALSKALQETGKFRNDEIERAIVRDTELRERPHGRLTKAK